MSRRFRFVFLLSLSTLTGIALFLLIFAPERVGVGSIRAEWDRSDLSSATPVRATQTYTAESNPDTVTSRPDSDLASTPVAPLSPVSALLDRASLLSEVYQQAEAAKARRVRVWETSGPYPFIRTEEVVSRDKQGNQTVESLVAMVADQVLVQFIAGEVDSTVFDQLEAIGLELLDDITGSGLFRAALTDFRNPTKLPLAIATANRSVTNISFAEPDFLVFASGTNPNDSLVSQQWALTATSEGIDAFSAWDSGTSAGEVIVAVIDSGVRLTHQDLKDNLWINPGETPGNGLDDDKNGFIDDIHGINSLSPNSEPVDDNGHGSHVAGIIGAQGNNGVGIAGVTWDVQMMVLKFLDEDGIGIISNAVQCMDYAGLQGASIINASWGGGGRSLALDRAIERLGESGAVLVAAAGNEDRDISSQATYPAAFSHANIITVAASDQIGNLARFSNYGQGTVDLAAPGIDIYSTWNTDDSSYSLLSGTSMAAPMVSGAIALLLGREPTLGPDGATSSVLRNSIVDERLLEGITMGRRLYLGPEFGNTPEAPVNDQAEDAIRIVERAAYWEGPTRGATFSPEEPRPPAPGFSGSIWFLLSSELGGTYQIAASALGDQTAVSLFSAPPSASTQPASSSYGTYPGQDVDTSIRIQPGAEVYIAVYGTGTGARNCSLKITARPANDDFWNASVLTRIPFDLSVYTSGATAEQGEPVHGSRGSGHTLWWQWTPPRTGLFSLSTYGSRGDTILAVYQGISLPTLDLVGANDDAGSGLSTSQIAFEAVEGNTYSFALDVIGNPPNRVRLIGEYSSPPVIASDLEDVHVPVGQTVTLTSSFRGTPPIRYQWYRDGTALPNSTESKLTLLTPTIEDSGNYWVTATNASGQIESRHASVNIGIWLPYITSQPRDRSVRIGDPVILSVNYRGTPPLAFQWNRNGEPLAGANNATLKIDSASLEDSGEYTLSVTNEHGSVTSESVHLDVSTSPGPTWSVVYPGTQLIDFESFRDVGDEVWALGEGLFQVSQPDDTWETRDTGLQTTLIDAAAGSGRYVLTDNQGRILESTDGYAWTNRRIEGIANRSWVVFGNDTFVAADTSASLYISTAQSVWQRNESPVPDGQNPVMTFHHGLFYAAVAGHSGKNHAIVTSPDGVNWQTSTVFDGTDEIFHDFQHGNNGELYLVGPGSQVRKKTEDGEWGLLHSRLRHHSLIVSRDGFYGLRNDRIYQSNDLVSWKKIGDSSAAIRDLHHREGRFFLHAGPAVFSTTAIDQAFLDSLPPLDRRDLYSGDEFIKIDRELYSGTIVSGDGSIWRLGNREIRGREWTYGNGFFLEASHEERGRHPGLIQPLPEYPQLVSPDLFAGYLSAFGHDRHAFLESSAVHLSVDGSTWTTVTLPDSASWTSFEFIGGRFIGLSDDGRILVGSGSGSWTVVSSGHAGPLTDVAYGLDAYAVTTASETLLTSSDAISWQSRTFPDDHAPFSIAHNNGRFMAIGNSWALESADLNTWSRIDPDVPRVKLRAIESINGTFVLLTQSHEILQFGPPLSLAPEIEVFEPVPNQVVKPLDTVGLDARVSDPENLRVTTRIVINGELRATRDTETVRHTEIVQDADYQVIVLSAENEAGLHTSHLIVLGVSPYRTEPIFPVQSTILAATEFKENYYRGGTHGLLQHSKDGRNWTDLPPIKNEGEIRSLIATDDRLFAIISGFIFSSPNGIDWTRETYAEQGSVTPIGDLLFASRPGPQVRSADGIWHSVDVNFGSPVAMNGIYYGGNQLAYTSLDGINWTEVDSFNRPYPGGPFLLDGQVVYFDYYSLDYHASRNGVDWVAYPGPPDPNPDDPEGRIGNPVAVGRGLVAGNFTESYITYDLQTWTKLPGTGFRKGGLFGDTELLLFTDSLYAMAPGLTPRLVHSFQQGDIGNASYWGFFSTETHAVFTPLWEAYRVGIVETDGNGAWLVDSPQTQSDPAAWAFTDGVAAIMGADWASFTTLVKSGDEDWEMESVPTEEAFAGIAGSKTRLVAVGNTHKYSTSTDGVQWTSGYLLDYDKAGPDAENYRYGPNWVAYHAPIDRFVAGGSTGIWLSQNGQNWTNHPDPKDIPKAYSNGTILLAGYSNQLWTSSDAITWSKLPAGTGDFDGGDRLGLIGPGLFGIADNNLKTILASQDGTNWLSASNPDTGLPFKGTMVESDDLPRIISEGSTWISHDFGASWIRERQTVYDGLEREEFISLRGQVFDFKSDTREPALVDLSVEISSTEPIWIEPGKMTQLPLRIRNNSTSIPFTGSLDVQLVVAPQAHWIDTPLSPPQTVSIELSALAPGGVAEVELEFPVPTTVPGGQHFLAAWIDSGNDYFEINEANNYGVSNDPILNVRSWLLTVESDPGGTVLITPVGPRYAHGSVVTITPRPNSGYGFSAWDEEPSSRMQAFTVTMDRDRMLKAHFEPRYLLNLQSTGRGSVSVDPELPSYPPGSTVTLTAVPDPEWHFGRWDSDISGPNPVYSITMDQDQDITARFTQSFSVFGENHFTPEELNEPLSWPDADPDADGHSNLVEFLLGGDPRATDSTPLIEMTHGSGRIKLTYTRRSVAGGYQVRAFASSDLSEWTTTGVTEKILQTFEDLEWVEASVERPVNAPVHLQIQAVPDNR